MTYLNRQNDRLTSIYFNCQILSAGCDYLPRPPSAGGRGGLKPALRIPGISSSIQKSGILLRKHLWPWNQLELNPCTKGWQDNLLMCYITKSGLKKEGLAQIFFLLPFFFFNFYKMLVPLRSLSKGRQIAVSGLEIPVLNLRKFIFYFKNKIRIKPLENLTKIVPWVKKKESQEHYKIADIRFATT